jgi:hypothetical protein
MTKSINYTYFLNAYLHEEYLWNAERELINVLPKLSTEHKQKMYKINIHI